MTVDDILQAFPDQAPYPGPITGCPPEIFDIAGDFGGKSWKEIDSAMCDKHDDAFNMLDPKPLCYFLPAFLAAALDKPHSMTADSLVYFVCRWKTFAKFAKLLDSRQISVVLGVVESIMNADNGCFAEQTEVILKTRARYLGHT
ncbi:MAG TPA: hypothetical protein VFE47_13825 [Tepidisphaeraceae bacterium]|jgi:hypothetical protein|nr:hypothetical protein [Tepidisphaeraceae bacterium]